MNCYLLLLGWYEHGLFFCFYLKSSKSKSLCYGYVKSSVYFLLVDRVLSRLGLLVIFFVLLSYKCSCSLVLALYLSFIHFMYGTLYFATFFYNRFHPSHTVHSISIELRKVTREYTNYIYNVI